MSTYTYRIGWIEITEDFSKNSLELVDKRTDKSLFLEHVDLVQYNQLIKFLEINRSTDSFDKLLALNSL